MGTNYSIKVNKTKRTYTIRRYDNGKLIFKLRSYPQSKEDFSENWTENDIKSYLKNAIGDYYAIK